MNAPIVLNPRFTSYMEEIIDLLILGGGPIGLACALEAKAANLKLPGH
jgi:NADPH-dependent 2,4-dienoyl-CoA reductase/sulfur reductase-like enzyme